MEGKVVFEGKIEKGLDVIIRYPKKTDVKIMLDYINTLSKEQTFIRLQGEEISFEEEEKFISSMLKKIAANTGVQLLVFHNNQLIGASDILMRDRVEKHEGVFGITIAKDYRGKGVGTILMQKVIDEAIKSIPQLRIITLGIFDNNPVAADLYKKLGFREYGRLPQGIFYKGSYINHVYMYKIVRD